MSNPTNLDDMLSRIKELAGNSDEKSIREVIALTDSGRSICRELDDKLDHVMGELKDYGRAVDEATKALKNANSTMKSELISDVVDCIGGNDTNVAHELYKELSELKGRVY